MSKVDYKSIYMTFFNISPDETVLCEVCNAVAVDIHHIIFRSQGGKNNIDNLIALCRNCHDISHGKVKDKTLAVDQLKSIIQRRG